MARSRPGRGGIGRGLAALDRVSASYTQAACGSGPAQSRAMVALRAGTPVGLFKRDMTLTVTSWNN